MLTSGRLQRGEGNLEPFDPEAWRAPSRRNMAEEEARIEEECNFRKAFYSMAENVSQLVLRLERAEGRIVEELGSKHGDGGGDPPHSPPANEGSSSPHHNNPRNPRETSKKPFFKLYFKFDLPVFNGESNTEKLNNWIRQIEVYCRIQQIVEDEAKIQLASL